MTHNGWSTTSFVNVRARGQQDRVASSNNSIFLYYAQTIYGRPELRWAGDQNKTVDGKVYPMRSTQLALDRERNRFLLQMQLARAPDRTMLIEGKKGVKSLLAFD